MARCAQYANNDKEKGLLFLSTFSEHSGDYKHLHYHSNSDSAHTGYNDSELNPISF